MAKEKNNDWVLASLQMAHVVMKRKRPYTELESVFLSSLEIAADTLQGGEKAIAKVRQIPLSDSTTKRRCDRISEDLLNQLVVKLKKAHLMVYNSMKLQIFQMRCNWLCIVGLPMKKQKSLWSITCAI